MKEIKVDFDKFKFDEFVDAMLNFGLEVAEFSWVVPWIKKSGDEQNYEEEIERDYLFELKDEGKLLYFDFTTSNSGDPIECADGNKYEIDESSRFGMDVSDTIGYLLSYKDGELSINSAMSTGPAIVRGSIDMRSDCDVFDEPMEEFIQKFIE